jgi:hypothetical protein
MISEVISIRTWISIASFATVLAVLTAPVSSQILDNTKTADTELEVPQYDSPGEVFFELAIPFLAVFILFRLGAKPTFELILGSPDQIDPSAPSEEEISKYANLFSLIVTASIIPTHLWQLIKAQIALIGAIPVVLLSMVLVYVVYAAAREILR